MVDLMLTFFSAILGMNMRDHHDIPFALQNTCAINLDPGCQTFLINRMLIGLHLLNGYFATHDAINPRCISQDNWHENNRGGE